MTLQRANPLPPGRYWIDVFTRAGVDAFDTWAAAAGPGNVTIEARESSARDTAWFLWTQTASLQFDQKRFGFPTIAAPNIHTRDDTGQAPAAPGPLDVLNDGLAALNIPNVGTIALLVLGYLVLSGGLGGDGRRRR